MIPRGASPACTVLCESEGNTQQSWGCHSFFFPKDLSHCLLSSPFGSYAYRVAIALSPTASGYRNKSLILLHFTVSKPSPGRSASGSHPGSAHQAQCFPNLSVQMSHLEILIPQVWAEIWDGAFFTRSQERWCWHTWASLWVVGSVPLDRELTSRGLCCMVHPLPLVSTAMRLTGNASWMSVQSKSKTSTRSHTPNFS